MRIALANSTWRHVGGIETYLGRVAKGLAAAGHSIALFTEHDAPSSQQRVHEPEGSMRCCVAELGLSEALARLRAWGPDVIYVNKLHEPAHEAALQKVAPTVLSIHDYHGTCISGSKATARPSPRPCERRFGPACLAHYLARGCGGLNPFTMGRLYATQARRLAVMQGYEGVVVHSEHMRGEYARHGIRSDRVHMPRELASSPTDIDALATRPLPSARGEARLVFVARLDRMKGGHVLLRALPRAAARLGYPVRLRIAGAGPSRGELEQAAGRMARAHPLVRVEFMGWVARGALDALYWESDLLVVPSVCTEPFGLVGLEAGLRSLPVAAFAVGGIPEWLHDGVNGFLAPADPATPRGLADAIVRCLADDCIERLRAGARAVAEAFPDGRDLSKLVGVLQRAACRAAP